MTDTDSRTLHQRQVTFASLLPRLIDWCFANGYEVVGGEWERTQEQANVNAQSGAGISNSLHILCLAQDLKLFKDGKYLTQTEDYRPAGEYWKTLDPLCCWGGDFVSRPDGDHFSITFQGVR